MHSSSIGQEELSESEFVTTHTDTTVKVERWMLDIEPPPFWLKNMRDKFPGFEGRVDRWQIIHYEAPSTIRIDVGVAKAGTGAPQGDRSQGVNGYVMNTISPETDRTSPLLLVVPAQLPTRQPAHHHAAAQRCARRLRRRRSDAHRSAGGDRREPGLRVLQPQHRCGRHVGASPDRARASRQRVGCGRPPCRRRPGARPADVVAFPAADPIAVR